MITVREFLADINAEVENHPELLDMPIIYSSDDEGNSYQTVSYQTSKKLVEDLNIRDLEVYNLDEEDDDRFNCLCIN